MLLHTTQCCGRFASPLIAATFGFDLYFAQLIGFPGIDGRDFAELDHDHRRVFDVVPLALGLLSVRLGLGFFDFPARRRHRLHFHGPHPRAAAQSISSNATNFVVREFVVVHCLFVTPTSRSVHSYPTEKIFQFPNSSTSQPHQKRHTSCIKVTFW
ncbi:hypothetical protein A7G45_23820 [Mycolicibacterium llatzerense]|nr:hypothetical protein [Mycolicibacterium llatzerense]MCT7372029.1 hypothetical protein [Mycolicibacterium llatzerense]